MKTQNIWTVKSLYLELVTQGYNVKKTQYYEWLDKALVRPHKDRLKAFFTDRDRVKLLKFAEFRTKYPMLSLVQVREMLKHDLQQNPGDYPE